MKFGTVKHWDAAKGYGFITTEDDEDVFLHASNVTMNLKPEHIREGLRVKFDIERDMRGDKAVNVRKV
ncbi:cold-shock protein [candidate division KSB1 bacterium]|nr:cold-shock protein [candidate division KSB1 bacterium]RQW00987.1 MAG: cold-shock protein [candidate division KSB1 bacterium]